MFLFHAFVPHFQSLPCLFPGIESALSLLPSWSTSHFIFGQESSSISLEAFTWKYSMSAFAFLLSQDEL